MRSDTLSILGLYNYDNTIFDLLTLPEGLDNLTLIKSICAELSDMELLYPNPEVMKDLIGVWSAGCQYEWQKLYDTMQIEYNPIDNYDRTETRTLSSQGSGTGTDGGSDQYATTKSHDRTGTHAANNTNSATKGNTNNSTEKTAAFNADSMVNKSQINGTNSDTINGTDTEQATDTDHTTETESAATNYGKTKQETFNKTDIETIRARGNIGVVTTMQMLKEQRDIVKFNMYDIITEEFKLRFCILVY